MSPAAAAARRAGPPIVDGNASIASSGAFIAPLFPCAGGGNAEVIRGGSAPVGSAALGGGNCDGDCGAAGLTAGGALGATGGAALGCGLGAGGLGTAIGAACGVGASAEFGAELPPALPAAGASWAPPGAGATNGAATDGAAGNGSALPDGSKAPGCSDPGCKDPGCDDPLCGCGAFGFLSGAAGSGAGCCQGAEISSPSRLSWKTCHPICSRLTVKSTIAPTTKSF